MAGAWPVDRANKVSPSLIVCTGRMARARPSWPAPARRWARALVSGASVATTPMVVLLPARMACGASLVFENPLALLAAFGVFLPAMAYRARQEETALAAEFPAYAEYRRRTGMFFPKLSHPWNRK